MIQVKNIIKSYGTGESRSQVLQSVSLEMEEDDFVVILGASGSGKSTFLNVISGLEHPDSGKVFYDGVDITALSDDQLTTFCLTIYQYALLRIMVDLVFKDVAGVPVYEFDVPVMVISLVTFMIVYEILMFVYSDKIKRISIKEIMIE